MRRWAGLLAALVLASCGGAPAPTSAHPVDMPMPMAGPSTSPDFIAPSFVLAATPAPPAFRALRAFVASETTDSVWVLEGGERFTVVGRIAVGKMPHNLAVSPDAKWIAVANRMGNSVSILDPYGLVEVARVPVGRQPHDITWAPDSGTIFVGHERDNFITRIEAGTWLALRPLMVGVPQHDLAISHTRPNDLFFTVTNSNDANRQGRVPFRRALSIPHDEGGPRRRVLPARRNADVAERPWRALAPLRRRRGTSHRR